MITSDNFADTDSSVNIANDIMPYGQISSVDDFCNYVNNLRWPAGKSIFEQMITALNSSEDDLGRFIDFDIYNLALKARTIFGDVSKAWTHYQIYANRNRADIAFKLSTLPPPAVSQPKDKDRKQITEKAEIIDNIAEDERFFTSSDLPLPAPLSNVIRAQFLRIVEKYGWKEALPLIYSSRQGCHAILYDETEGNEYPELKSSNMVVESDKGPNSSSLVFNDDFRGKNWESMSSTDHIAQVITDYVEQLDFEPLEPIDFDALNNLPQNPTDNAELEDSLFRAIGLKNCVEQIRLTTAEQNAFKHSYHGVTRYAELFTSLRKPFSLTVSYEDLCGGLKGLNRIYDDKPCYLPLSKCQMKPDELATQKYMLLNQNVCQNMRGTDWRIVGLMAQKLMKGQNIDKLVEKFKNR